MKCAILLLRWKAGSSLAKKSAIVCRANEAVVCVTLLCAMGPFGKSPLTGPVDLSRATDDAT